MCAMLLGIPWGFCREAVEQKWNREGERKEKEKEGREGWPSRGEVKKGRRRETEKRERQEKEKAGWPQAFGRLRVRASPHPC